MKSIGAFAVCFAAIAVLFAAGAAAQEGQEEGNPPPSRDRAVFAPDPRLCTAPRWPRAAAELTVV
jgi:hypothetical protein